MPTSDAAHRRSEHFTTRPRVGSPQGWWDTAGRLCSPELSVASGNVLTMKRAYTALCNATDRDQDLITALRWALDHAEDGQPVTLWCWDKEGLPAGPRGSGPSLGIAVHSEHPRPRGGRPFRAPNGLSWLWTSRWRLWWRSSPSMTLSASCTPTCRRTTSGADGSAGTIYLSTVLGINAYRPECLSGRPIQTPKPLITNPAMAVAMMSFTGRSYDGTTMHDYGDGDRVTHGLMELRKGGPSSSRTCCSLLPCGRAGRDVKRCCSGTSPRKSPKASRSVLSTTTARTS
ncbi:hypothetical protein SAMN02910418_01746 [Bowdeniella nasicola]|uniref:Uncharacterized protein n=1 Tax=Bowdeniella nasicola TaxID=208480 RepID=A0A1H4BR09_9ACTO|nr:hypothetical protein SAMN02910418_01746 [Bowdeniella nasicola]